MNIIVMMFNYQIISIYNSQMYWLSKWLCLFIYLKLFTYIKISAIFYLNNWLQINE
jgi:hypothetical protein